MLQVVPESLPSTFHPGLYAQKGDRFGSGPVVLLSPTGQWPDLGLYPGLLMKNTKEPMCISDFTHDGKILMNAFLGALVAV